MNEDNVFKKIDYVPFVGYHLYKQREKKFNLEKGYDPCCFESLGKAAGRDVVASIYDSMFICGLCTSALVGIVKGLEILFK